MHRRSFAFVILATTFACGRSTDATTSGQGGATSVSSSESTASASPTAAAAIASSTSASSSSTSASSSSAASSSGADGGAQAFSFAFVGCNRVEKADIDPNAPSTANVEELTRTFDEIAAMSPLPKYFFFVGDMVYGYKDAPELELELNAWVALWTASKAAAMGVELVALPGNHEMENKKNNKLAYVEAEQSWVKVMAPFIKGSNGPGPGGPDNLQTDQSKLSYSFDFGGTHFVILNSDPVGADSHVPSAWVKSDVDAARAAGAKHVFALAHKPAYPSPLTMEGGLDIDVPARDAFWSALEGAQAEAMLAAHNHLWYKTQPKKSWQVIAGNGGSLLESSVTGKDAFYGYTVVDVKADGTVTTTSYGRDVPAASYLDKPTGPTTVRDTQDITWK